MRNFLFNNLVWIGCGYAHYPRNLLNDSAKVHLFDANPAITSQLTKLYSNDVNVVVHNKAISSASGVVDFYYNKVDEFSSVNKPKSCLEDIFPEAKVERIESLKSIDICEVLIPFELNAQENNLLILDILDQNSLLINRLNESDMLGLFDWVCIRASSIQLYNTTTSMPTRLQSIRSFPKEYEFLTRIEGDEDFGYYMFRRKTSFNFVKEISEQLTALKQELITLQKSLISKDNLIERLRADNIESGIEIDKLKEVIKSNSKEIIESKTSHQNEIKKLNDKNKNLESSMLSLDNDFSRYKSFMSETLENYESNLNEKIDDLVKPTRKSNSVLKKKYQRTLNFVKGTTSNLMRSNPKFKFALDHTVHFFNSDAITTFIPKSACSSLRLTAAMQNLNLNLEKDYNWIHLNNGTFNASLSDVVTAKYTFVILRCPYTRLLSAYLDKFLSRSLELWRAIDRDGRKLEPEDYTFEQYVDHVCKFLNSDQHWQPQSSFLIYEQYDDYFCMEDIEFMNKKLKSRLGFDLLDSRHLYKHSVEKIVFEDSQLDVPSYKMSPLELLIMKKEGRLPSKKSFFSEPILEKVKKTYSKDIDLYLRLFCPDNLLF